MVDVRLEKPACGQQSAIQYLGGKAVPIRFVLDFPLDDVFMDRAGADLVLSFKDGAEIVLEKFYIKYRAESMPDFVIGGQVLAGADFLNSFGAELMPVSSSAALEFITVGNGISATPQLGSMTESGGVGRQAVVIHVEDLLAGRYSLAGVQGSDFDSGQSVRFDSAYFLDNILPGLQEKYNVELFTDGDGNILTLSFAPLNSTEGRDIHFAYQIVDSEGNTDRANVYVHFTDDALSVESKAELQVESVDVILSGGVGADILFGSDDSHWRGGDINKMYGGPGDAIAVYSDNDQSDDDGAGIDFMVGIDNISSLSFLLGSGEIDNVDVIVMNNQAVDPIESLTDLRALGIMVNDAKVSLTGSAWDINSVVRAPEGYQAFTYTGEELASELTVLVATSALNNQG